MSISEGEQKQKELEEKQKAGINQITLTRLFDDEQYANAVDPELGISNRSTAALRLLSYYHESDLQPSETEKGFVQAFLNDVTGDMKFNRILRKIPDKVLETARISIGVATNIINYTYKTRRYKIFPDVFDRLKRNLDKKAKNIGPEEGDRITLPQYGAVCDVSGVDSIMRGFERFIAGDPELEKFHKQIQTASEMVQKINSYFKSQIKESKEPGRIVFDNPKKQRSLRGWVRSFFDWFRELFISKHSHASKLYSVEGESPSLSHVNPDPISEEFKMRNYLYADIYRINVNALISEEHKSKLQQALGDDWQSVVNGMYAQIEKKIHDNTVEKFSALHFPAHGEFVRRGLTCLLGHKQFSPNDFDEIHAKVFGEFYKVKEEDKKEEGYDLICSEFVTHTLIAALAELDKRVKEKLVEKGIIPSESRIVKIPIGRHENLRRVTPDRLIRVLKAYGCITKKEPPVPIIARLFEKSKVSKKEKGLDSQEQEPERSCFSCSKSSSN